jgi:uncharacterized membrane protein YfcA
MLALIIVAGVAALVNGGIGYGFSTIVTPIGLLWLTSRVLNPAVVLVEFGVNLVLLYRERAFISATHMRVRPMMMGVIPGVLLGTLLLSSIAPSSVRLVVYGALLPLILLQLIGQQRTILNERHVGGAVGAGVGTLYALTTISGPPLALFWRNQGMAKGEFRCALAQMRVVEGSTTIVAYLAFGLFTPAAVGTVPLLLIPVVIGVPIGTLLLAGFTREFFSKIVMAADGVIVSYGLASVLVSIDRISPMTGVAVFFTATVCIGVVAWNELRKIPFYRIESRIPDRSFEWDPGI